MNKKIAFIGSGKMAEAIINGLISANVIEKKNILINDIDQKRVDYFNSMDIKSKSLKDLIQYADIIFLSVKPNNIKEICENVSNYITKDKIIISIAAGISITFLEKYLKVQIPIIRVMPNFPAIISQGMIVYCTNEQFNSEDKKTIEQLLQSIGKVIALEEKYFDIVTGLSGSGPAYIFIVINALAEGGVKMGLPKDIALQLAAQTVLGSAELVLKTGKHPEELKDMVTSPGGTTVEGLKILEDYKIRSAFIEAVEKATIKSKILIKE